jgi:ubiquinone/menaquinone biosynthesis C-methylase UbiE
MFLSRRDTQEEYFDSERPINEVAGFFNSLGRVNRFFDFAEPFRNMLPRLLTTSQCRSLTILDVGAGDGALGKIMETWAQQRGWTWQVINLDMSLAALSLHSRGTNVVGSATRLPFCTGSVDVVIASQMAHHLTDSEVTQLLGEAWRVASRAVLMCDLHRNAGLYIALKLLFCFQTHSAAFKADALLSVKKAWRVKDLAELARAAGLEPTVKLHFGARVLLHATKAAGHDRPEPATHDSSAKALR